ncbi:MAG: thioredoxin family protein [Pseudoclavibacter sp.]
MNFVWAVVVVAGVIVVPLFVAWLVRRAEGRQRNGNGTVFRPGDLPGLNEFAPGATLVQFSTEFCTTCPGTRRFLRQLTAGHPGVAYLDVDLTRDGELARRLHILQTPTVFLLGAGGRLVTRFGGAPKPVEVRSALAGVLGTVESTRPGVPTGTGQTGR